jgi:hypothetical protein
MSDVERLFDELQDRCGWFLLSKVHDHNRPNGWSWEVLGIDDDGRTETFHGNGPTVEQALRDANWPESERY